MPVTIPLAREKPAKVSRRLDGLDALRGIAATSVMTYHYTTRYGETMGGHAPPGVSLAFPYGNFGVELFFIISGFVIFMTMERSRSALDFLVSRFARLYPAFLASFCVTLVASAALGGFGPPYDISRLIANLTMAPELFNRLEIDGSYWSLMYELVFYVLGACVFFGLRPSAPEPACAIWLAAAIAMRLTGAGQYCLLVQITAAEFCQLFVVGIMLYRVHSGRANPLTWAVLILAFAMTSFGPRIQLNDLTGAGYSGLIVGFAGLVWLATTPRFRLPMIPPLLFLGRVSYPLYLVHQELGFTVIARLETAGIPPNVAVAATMSLAIVTAWVISSMVEYPVQRWLRTRYQVWRDGPSRVPVVIARSGGGRT